MIEAIRLKDFLSHEDTAIELEDGINVFVGSNGAGKSSVIDAITYALYGEHTRDTDRNLVRRGASGSAVSLTFTYGHDRYIVERVLGPGGRLERAVLRQLAPIDRPLIAGERKQYGESLNQRVAALLRLDYEKMRVAAIIQQGELESIIQYTPSKFKALMDSLIGIDRLGTAYEAMREPIEEFRNRLRAECLGKYDDQNYQQLLDDIEQVVSEIGESERNRGIVESELNSANERYEKLRARLSELEPLRLKREELERQRAQLNSYVSKLLEDMGRRKRELEVDIPMAEKMLEASAVINSAQAELNEITQEESRLTEAISELESAIGIAKKSKQEISGIESEIKKESGELQRTGEKLDELNAEMEKLGSPEVIQFPENLEEMIEDLGKSRDALRDRISMIKEKVRNYEEIKERGICPTCDSDAKTVNVEFKLTSAVSELASVRAELESVEQSISEKRQLLNQRNEYMVKIDRKNAVLSLMENYRAQIEQIKSRISSLTARRTELETDVERLGSLEAEREARKKELKALRDREKDAREKYTSGRQAESWLEAKSIHSMEDIENMKAELKEIETKIRTAGDRSDIRNMSIDEISEQLVKMVLELEDETRQFDESEYDRLQRDVKSSEAEISRIAGRAEAIRLKIVELQEEKSKLDAVRGEVEGARKYITVYENIRKEIFNRDGSLATSLRSWAIRELSLYASEYVRSFGIGISEVRLSEKKRDVSIECYSPNGMMDIKSLSGGESVAIALAIRFAMARLMGMGMIDFIILDEPTVYLDEERKRSLVNIISGFNAGQGTLKQMVIITHDREIFENSTVDAMFQFEKQNGITKVKKT